VFDTSVNGFLNMHDLVGIDEPEKVGETEQVDESSGD